MEGWEWVLFIIVGILLAVLSSDFMGYMDHIPVSYVIFLIAFMGLWSSEYILLQLYRGSSVLIATNFTTTSNGKYYPAGDYAIYTMGDIDYVFSRKGKKGCIICPRDAVNHFGKHTVLNVNPREYYLDELHPDVVKKIKELDIEPPYFMGLASERSELVEPSITRLENQVTEQDTFLNMLKGISKGKFEVVGDVLDFAGKTRESTEKGSWLKKFMGSTSKESDKSENQ